MRYKSASATMLWLFAEATWAQSSVTLYGTVDTGIRYETNSVTYGANGLPASTGSRFGLPEGGGPMESYWGFKGSEDLGAGLKTLFQIETHFDASSGNLSPESGPQFQISYVGLQSSLFGQFTFGRQYNVLMSGVSLVYGTNYWAGPDNTSIASSPSSS
ncbi:MAG: hypothetical protein CBARDMAM_5051 [uncultured Caballeronia sp.]|nr:MAG: hypothetical protein CBARDMAM_5051 [uncultured Caballeronia sp.]